MCQRWWFNSYREQCHNLISATYKTSCKTGQGIEEMFTDIAQHLMQSNQSRIQLQNLARDSFKIDKFNEDLPDDSCSCWSYPWLSDEFSPSSSRFRVGEQTGWGMWSSFRILFSSSALVRGQQFFVSLSGNYIEDGRRVTCFLLFGKWRSSAKCTSMRL